MPAINYWWITASERNPKQSWHWRYYFENPSDPTNHNDFGGPKWIKSKVSFARIKEMCAGDVVVAYQAGEGVVGLAYIASEGYPHVESGNYDTFDLKPKPTVWLDEPIPLELIRELSDAKRNFEFLRVLRGSVFRVSERGFDALIEMIKSFSPAQQKAITRFLRHSAGYRRAV